MAFGTPLVVVASATQTTTGVSPAIPLQDVGNQLCLATVVTAASGTSPTLTPSVEWSMDGTNFVVADPPDVATALTATGGSAKFYEVKGPFYRVRWTIGGTTPSFTFAVSAYVTP